MILVATLLLALSSRAPSRAVPIAPARQQERSEYRVDVQRADSGYRRFRESTSVIVRESRYASVHDDLRVHAIGLLAREVRMPPVDDFGDGATVVVVRGLRRNAFVGTAESDSTPHVTDYVTGQSVRWTMRSTARGISFAFLPPPYQFARPAIDPFIAAAGWSDAALILSGMVLGACSIAGVLQLLSRFWPKGRRRISIRRRRA